jgi:hypothetical protein
MRRYFWLLFAITGFVWSCSDSELLTPGDEFQEPIMPGTYSVEIDGALTDFSETTSVNSNDASTQINGANEEGQTISIMLSSAVSEGTYTQGSNAMISIVLGGEGIFNNIDSTGQLLPLIVTVTELDMFDMTVSGTFTGSVYNSADETTRELTNGQFVELPLTITEGGDAILKATFGVDDETQTELDFSTNAHATGMTTNAVISGDNVDEIQNLSITVPGGIEAGVTYTEVDEVVIQVNLGTSDNPNDVYTNYDEANDVYLPVSVTIDEITQDVEGNVIGSFTGTIQKFGSGNDEQIEITNGMIDVPITAP